MDLKAALTRSCDDPLDTNSELLDALRFTRHCRSLTDSSPLIQEDALLCADQHLEEAYSARE